MKFKIFLTITLMMLFGANTGYGNDNELKDNSVIKIEIGKVVDEIDILTLKMERVIKVDIEEEPPKTLEIDTVKGGDQE
jgi:hypothetical protein